MVNDSIPMGCILDPLAGTATELQLNQGVGSSDVRNRRKLSSAHSVTVTAEQIGSE